MSELEWVRDDRGVGGYEPKPAGGSTVLTGSALTLSGSASGLSAGSRIPFDEVVADPAGYADLANNGFVIPADADGLYLVGLEFLAANLDVAADVVVGVIQNSGADINPQGGAPRRSEDATAEVSMSALILLSAGDTLRATLTFDGGGTSTVASSASRFWLVRVT